MAANFGWVKIQEFWPPLRPKKMLLTAEKVEIGPKMTNNQNGVKPDIFKITKPTTQFQQIRNVHMSETPFPPLLD